MSIVSKLYKYVLDPALTIAAHPIKSAVAIVSKEKTLKQEQEKFFSQSKLQQSAQLVISGLNVAGVTGIARAVAAKGAGVVTSALLKPATYGKAVAVLAIEGAVSKAPKKVVETVYQAGTGIPQFAGNVAEFASSPSLEGAKKIVQENPVIAGIVVAGAAYATGKVITSALQTYATTQNTEELRNQNLTPADSLSLPITSAGDQLPYTETTIPPSTKLTEEINPTPKRARRVKKKQSVTQNITQRVNVYDDDDHHHHYKTIKRRLF